MPPDIIVEIDVILYTPEQFQTIIRGLQIHVLVFQATPETFDVNVIQCFSIHGYLYLITYQHIGKLLWGELAALIGIKYLRLSV